MAHTRLRRVAALGGSGVLAMSFQAPAHADPTFTHVTTPSGRTTLLVDGGSPTFAISGTASSDVTTVDLVCVRGPSGATDSTVVATAVPVAGGAFSTVAPVPDPSGSSPVCRLKALPSGVLPDDDTTSFSGPILDIDVVKRTSDGTNTLDFRLTAGSGNGEISVASAGKCGDSSIGTLAADLSVTRDSDGCVGDLGGTAGSVRVDGHPALLPPEVLAFTNGTSPLSLSFHTRKSGQLTWTESAPLFRCSGTDTYPPSSPGACGSLVGTGVTFRRVGTYDRGGHQVRLRDAFTSSDSAKHRLRLVYGVESTPPPTGALGFAFPGHSGGFHGSTTGQVVTGLPKKAATVLVRSDRFAAEGDPSAGTRAITWSRPPSRLAFAADDATVFGMQYSLTVPKNGVVALGFTDSQATLTSTARALGSGAAADMMPTPRITSPGKGAVITGKRTKVTGVVRAGANGLPVSVTVNGHPAALKPSGAGRATFRVVFDESLGKHTLTARARDAGGNVRSTSITVRNK
jgi:hypothetical protein